MINQNTNLKLKINYQVDRISKLTNKKQELENIISNMIHMLEAIDRMYDSVNIELSDEKQKVKETKLRHKEITAELQEKKNTIELLNDQMKLKDTTFYTLHLLHKQEIEQYKNTC